MKCSTCGHHLHTCPTCGHTEPSSTRPLRTTPQTEEEKYASRVFMIACVLTGVVLFAGWSPFAAATPVLVLAFGLGLVPWDRRTPTAVRTAWRAVTGRRDTPPTKEPR